MQDPLLRFDIPAAVLSATRANTLLVKSSRVRDQHFVWTYAEEVCRIECSHDMAVLLATDIVLWGSAPDCSDSNRDACEAAMNTLLPLLRHAPCDQPAQAREHDRTA
jgi:hypothetical protein